MLQKYSNFGVEVQFRIKRIKVQCEISETLKGNRMGAYKHSPFTHRVNYCFTHLNIPFLFSFRSMEFWTPADNEQKPRDQCDSKGLYCCRRVPAHLFIVRNLTPSSFSVFHPFFPCQDEVAPCFQQWVTSLKSLDVHKAGRHVTLCKGPCACRPWHRHHCVTGRQSQCHRGHRATGPGHHSDGRIHLKYEHSLWPLMGHILRYLWIAANCEHASQPCLKDA